jgi:hypothetical protein
MVQLPPQTAIPEQVRATTNKRYVVEYLASVNKNPKSGQRWNHRGIFPENKTATHNGTGTTSVPSTSKPRAWIVSNSVFKISCSFAGLTTYLDVC